jgi:hypothetical protein
VKGASARAGAATGSTAAGTKGDRGGQRWVGFGVIGEHPINIGRALTRKPKAIIPTVG